MASGIGLLGLGLGLLAVTYLTAHTVPLGGYSLLIWVTLAGGLFRTVGAAVSARRFPPLGDAVPHTGDLFPAVAATHDGPAMVEEPLTPMEQDLWVLGLGPDVSTLKEIRRAYWELCASLATSSDPQTKGRLREAHIAYRRLRQLMPSRGRALPKPTFQAS
jgi:hypothetical protein